MTDPTIRHIHKWSWHEMLRSIFCKDCGKKMKHSVLVIILNKHEMRNHLPRRKKS